MKFMKIYKLLWIWINEDSDNRGLDNRGCTGLLNLWRCTIYTDTYSLKNMHVIRIIKLIIIITCGTVTWLWTHEDVDHRTELLAAFTHADAVTEDNDRSFQRPNKTRRLSSCVHGLHNHVTISCRWLLYSSSVCYLHEHFSLLRFEAST